MEKSEQLGGLSSQPQIHVGQVRAEAVKIATDVQIVGDLVVVLHRRLQTVLRPKMADQGRCHKAFEMHSELAALLHSSATTQERAIEDLQDLLARLEL
jgi:hypothetical protein